MNDLLIDRLLIFQTSYAWGVSNQIIPESGKQGFDDKAITRRNCFVFSSETLGYLHHQHLGVLSIPRKLMEGNWQNI